MASLRARVLNVLLRNTMKRRLGACQTALEVRKTFQSTPPLAPRVARCTPATLGGVSGEWVEAGSASAGTLLYLHGGGYVAMSAYTHRGITAAFALRGFRVFAADYRLAPEHPFPAGLDDTTAVWRALRSEVQGPLFVAGDSAGGGLSLALLLNLRDHHEAAPDAACLFSPWTDLAGTSASRVTNRDRDPLLAFDRAHILVSAYAGDADPGAPLISPVNADFQGLPPLILFVGDTEVLLDDSTRVAGRARAAGVAVDLRVYTEMPHVWPAMNVLMPEARRAMDEAAAFLATAGTRHI